MDNKKEKISNLELLEAMSGINEKYLKEADSLCIKKRIIGIWQLRLQQ